MNYRTNFNSSFANRGMALENDINETNKYYREYDIALIYKKPTPIRITKTNYQNMRVTDGFFECPSTLDYNGVYKGYYNGTRCYRLYLFHGEMVYQQKKKIRT